jgi:hypothetical protein
MICILLRTDPRQNGDGFKEYRIGCPGPVAKNPLNPNIDIITVWRVLALGNLVRNELAVAWGLVADALGEGFVRFIDGEQRRGPTVDQA